MNCKSIPLPVLNEADEFHSVLTIDAQYDANFFVEFLLLKVFQFDRTDETNLKLTKLESRIFRIDIGSTLFVTLDTLSSNRLVFSAQDNLENTFIRYNYNCEETVKKRILLKFLIIFFL